jgi:hypothetical protein
LNEIQSDIESKKLGLANDKLDMLERLKRKAIEIKEAGGYEAIPSSVNNKIQAFEETRSEAILLIL